MLAPMPHPLAAAEAAFLDLRDAHDARTVAEARGIAAAVSQQALADALEAVERELAAVEVPDAEDDRHALATMRRVVDDIRAGAGVESGPRLPGSLELEAAYTAASEALVVDGERTERLAIVGRLAREPDPGRRRRLFLALEALWRSVDGDGGAGSPYRALIGASAERWRAGGSPIDANARALGVDGPTIRAWCEATLAAWHDAVVAPAGGRGEPPVEPWDWWWRAGEAERRLAPVLPLERLRPISDAYHAAVGADLGAIGVEYDTDPGPHRPPVPVAYTTFASRPRRGADGSWSGARPQVMATYTAGGLGELTELVHETGHAIHIAAIRARPAFADWPDSDAFTEAVAELLALDTAEPRWQARWLAGGTPVPDVPVAVALRGRYADVVLDAAWAYLELLLHDDPERPANDAWTAITSRWLGIAPHPEWSWWAMRGQLVQEPGYMANYAIGAVLAADMRAAIRAARGDWTGGDPGWYDWVSERLFRFGLERTTADVLRGLLGRPPDAGALLGEIGRATG